MSDISPRRRLATRMAIAAGFLAVPLTASVGYAETVGSEPMPTAAPEAPLAPQVPDNPQQPEVPEAPVAPSPDVWIEEELGDTGERSSTSDSVHVERTVDDDGRVREIRRRVYRVAPQDMSPEERAEFEREMEEVEREIRLVGRERAEAAVREANRQFREDANIRREIRIATRDAANGPEVIVSCRNNPRQPVTSETTADGKTRLYVCETAGTAIARDAIKTARAAIAKSANMPSDARAEALAALDQELAELDAQ